MINGCKCRECRPVLDGVRADVLPTPCRSVREWDTVMEAMSDPPAPSGYLAVEVRSSALPVGSTARKDVPLARGLLDYFPAALAAVAELSRKGNDKHNPGEELHWARGKSTDHADCILRHLIDRGTLDPEDGISHTTKIAWRALALLQEELETAGAPLPRGARQ